MRSLVASAAVIALLTASALATSADASAATATSDNIAAKFAVALEPALKSGDDNPNMYTIEEPTSFRIWSAIPPMLATYPCARNVALAVERGGQPLGVVWLGVCRLGDELPADMLSTAVARARAAAAEREIAPIAAGFGELARRRRIGDRADLYEVTVLMNLSGTMRILRTALIVPDGREDVLVLQYEALRLCAAGGAPLCTAPAATEYGITQLGAYGVLMTPGPFYFKGKLGIMYTDVDFPNADSSTDPAYGVGVGFELFGLVAEIEYTITEADGADADFISFGLKF